MAAAAHLNKQTRLQLPRVHEPASAFCGAVDRNLPLELAFVELNMYETLLINCAVKRKTMYENIKTFDLNIITPS